MIWHNMIWHSISPKTVMVSCEGGPLCWSNFRLPLFFAPSLESCRPRDPCPSATPPPPPPPPELEVLPVVWDREGDFDLKLKFSSDAVDRDWIIDTRTECAPLSNSLRHRDSSRENMFSSAMKRMLISGSSYSVSFIILVRSERDGGRVTGRVRGRVRVERYLISYQWWVIND